MSNLLWVIFTGLTAGVVLAIMIAIIPSKKLLIVEKWIKAYRGKQE